MIGPLFTASLSIITVTSVCPSKGALDRLTEESTAASLCVHGKWPALVLRGSRVMPQTKLQLQKIIHHLVSVADDSEEPS